MSTMACATRNEGTQTASVAQDEIVEQRNNPIAKFFGEHFEEYRALSELRREGWNNPAGDEHFSKQRRDADNAKTCTKTATMFYNLMQKIGNEIDRETGGAMRVPDLVGTPRVLDFCAAPGGFLVTVLERCPSCEITAFSLPYKDGGHNLLIRRHPLVRENTNFSARYLDITMLAADMGVVERPANHPDADRFLPRLFTPGMTYNLVICDGMVLREHERASYREHCEPRRLMCTQLALGLEHLKPGGTMVILLHKLEMWHTIQCIRTFYEFSTVKLVKPKSGHRPRSSFYLVATEIQSQSAASLNAVQKWKKMWRLATFGPEEELYAEVSPADNDVQQMLDEFGHTLGEMGRPIWNIQAEALKVAPWMKKKKSTQ